MEITPTKFLFLVRLYNIYQKKEYMKEGFRTSHELSQSMDNSFNPSSYTRRVVRELLQERILIISNGVKLDREKLAQLIKEQEFYKQIFQFLDSRTHSILDDIIY